MWTRFAARLAVTIAIAAILQPACRRSSVGAIRPDVLVVVPAAYDLKYFEDYDGAVSYRVPDPFPADRTLASIRAKLEPQGWKPYPEDLLNPGTPSSHERGWTDYIDGRDGEDDTVFAWGAPWAGPEGDFVIYSLSYRYRKGETRETATPHLEVTGIYMSAPVVAKMREFTASQTLDRGLQPPPQSIERHRESFQTCSQCGSTRGKRDDEAWSILYASPTSTHCAHDWQDGVNTGTPEIPDTRVVLVRKKPADSKNYAYGAFILREQRFEPTETVSYIWVFRMDGQGKLDPSDPAVQTGDAQLGQPTASGPRNGIAFGPFDVPWSGARPGFGFVYYPRYPGAQRSPDDWELAVTDLTSFAGLDAADPQFGYKTSPVD
jgi:hypothetical protein